MTFAPKCEDSSQRGELSLERTGLWIVQRFDNRLAPGNYESAQILALECQLEQCRILVKQKVTL